MRPPLRGPCLGKLVTAAAALITTQSIYNCSSGQVRVYSKQTHDTHHLYNNTCILKCTLDAEWRRRGRSPLALGLCHSGIIIDGEAAAAGINFIGSDPDTSSLDRPQLTQTHTTNPVPSVIWIYIHASQHLFGLAKQSACRALDMWGMTCGMRRSTINPQKQNT
jgi:hypothetical protein